MNGNNATLNQLVETFKVIALQHGQLHAFGQGEPSEITTLSVENYPLLWITILPANLTINTIQFNFRVYVCDLVQDNRDNELEILSDNIRILWDIIAILENNYELETTYTNAEPFTEKLDDRVAGWYLDIGIVTAQTLGVCDVPLKQNS